MEAPDLRGVSVLVIEDDFDLRKIFRTWLEGQGVNVREAGEGFAAIAEIRRAQPDVILCDLYMPGMDGCEFVERLKREPRYGHIPVLALTGSVSHSTMMRTLEAGFHGYMVKPVTKDVIVAKIAGALGR
jgi:CheY-like chemotaxis protein